MNLSAKYSVILTGRNASEKNVKEFITKGLKTIVFLNGGPENIKWCRELKSNLLFTAFGCEGILQDAIIEDGDFDRAGFNGNVLRQVSGFNYEQFLVEHAPYNRSLIVKASAGTGKTTVMVDRVMFLLRTVDGLEPKDIVMVTFTNDAALNMRVKIQKKLTSLYLSTRDFKYMQFLENLSEMRISTIDSFFNALIKAEGSSVGYGTKTSVRAFKREKDLILNKALNDVLNKEKNFKGGNYLETYVLETHKYIELAHRCWDKLNSMGYYGADIKKMNFGDSKNDSIINTILKKMLVRADALYEEMRHRQDSYTMADISQVLDELVQNDSVLNTTAFKYLFVDEFQDTDNRQIATLVWIKEKTGSNLFVVGDIKQSIYRFRGAEETAFDVLNVRLNNNVDEYELLKNYRTSSTVLQELNRIFNGWSDILPSIKGAEDMWNISLQAQVQDKGTIRMGIDKEISSDVIRGYYKLGETCVLCRTNKEVNKIAEICRRDGIPYIAQIEGDFFQSAPVRDLYSFLTAVLNPKSRSALFAFLNSSYVSENFLDINKLEMYGNSVSEMYEYLWELSKINGLESSLSRVANLPLFSFIKEEILKRNPKQSYVCSQLAKYSKLRDSEYKQQIDYVAMEYALNLNKLVQIIYDSFSGEQATLLEVCEYLKLKMATDHETDKIYPQAIENGSTPVIIKTVHKAKGMEYKNVILPFVQKPFIYDIEGKNFKSRYDFIIESQKQKNGRFVQYLGWQAIYGTKEYKNDYYDFHINLEKEAIRREEARILYVALTRAINNIYILFPYRIKSDSWAYFLQDIKEVQA